ncbi:MAG: disulfide bond formation protein DsbA, partial [Micavibrio aeruginosavorus]
MFLKKSDGVPADVASVPSGTSFDEGTVPAQAPATEQDPATQPYEQSGPVTIDIEKAFSPRTIGNADAPIKIIEYASMTCGHCAHFHNDVLPALKEKYVDTGKVFIEFREFPLNDP